jgi:SWI/SNF-related matrix-associated actin-dependent regulator 1 of chromatin subfamily A
VPEQLHPDCPLITPYTRKLGVEDETLLKLFHLRNWNVEGDEPIPFRWPTRLRRTVWDTLHNRDSGIPLTIRKYQLQAIHHLARMRRFIDGDSVGLGKTVCAIAAAAYIADRQTEPIKVIVLCTKSTTLQWADEFERFSTLRPMVMQDKYKKKKSYPARYAQLEDFLAGDDHDVLVAKYTSLIGTRRVVEGEFDENGFPIVGDRERVSQEIRQFTSILAPHGQRVILILDEGQKFKGTQTQIRIMVQYFQRKCACVWTLTATAMKNSIDEFYSVASAIGIRPLGFMQEFRDDFCIYRNVPIGKGREKKVLQGYQNIAEFKTAIRPFFLGRSQAQVKEPLPRLQTLIHAIDLDDEQRRLLLEDIPSGKYQLPPAIHKVCGEIVLRERDVDNEMTQLAVNQLVANHPVLLDPSDKKKFFTKKLSPKEEALLDLLDGDLKGEHVIVFTKSRSWINRLEGITAAGHFTDRHFLRITGAENEAQRERAKKLFQDPTGDHDLIVVNSAAIEGVNLQQAAHMVILDAPWSFGDLIQLVGRMVRMASPHSACTLHLTIAKGSVDEYVIETLKSKKGVFEKILGQSHTAGLLDDSEIVDLTSGMDKTATDDEFRNMLRAHAKSISMKMFLSGQTLIAAGEEDYKMAFEPGAKKYKTDYDIDEMVAKW